VRTRCCNRQSRLAVRAIRIRLPRFGDNGQGRPGRLVPYFSGGRCAVHVDDVVDGILAAVEKGIRGKRYILGGRM